MSVSGMLSQSGTSNAPIQYGGVKRRPPRSGDKNGEFISPFLLEN